MIKRRRRGVTGLTGLRTDRVDGRRTRAAGRPHRRRGRCRRLRIIGIAKGKRHQRYFLEHAFGNRDRVFTDHGVGAATGGRVDGQQHACHRDTDDHNKNDQFDQREATNRAPVQTRCLSAMGEARLSCAHNRFQAR